MPRRRDRGRYRHKSRVQLERTAYQPSWIARAASKPSMCAPADLDR